MHHAQNTLLIELPADTLGKLTAAAAKANKPLAEYAAELLYRATLMR